MSLGQGLGSFIGGAVQGAQAGIGIKNAKIQNRMSQIQLEQMESKNAQRIQDEDTQAEVNKLGQIGLERAKMHGGDNVKVVLDHYYTNTIPMQQQRLLQSGKVDAAEALGKFMETKQAKSLTENSAAAIRYASMGDYDSLGKSVEQILNISGSLLGEDGGVKLKGVTPIYNEQGAKTGAVSFTYTGKDGKDQILSFDSTKDLTQFIRNNAMPDKIVEYAFDQEAQAQKLRMETAKEQREWDKKIQEKKLDYGLDIGRDNNRFTNQRLQSRENQQFQLNRDAYGAQLDYTYGTARDARKQGEKVHELQDAVNWLHSQGYTDDQIRSYVPALLGVKQDKDSGRDPSKRIEDTIKTLSTNDPMFSRLPAAEQVSRARELVDLIDGKSSDGPKMVGGQLVYPSLSGGRAKNDAQTVDNPFGAESYYIDQKTGQIVQR